MKKRFLIFILSMILLTGCGKHELTTEEIMESYDYQVIDVRTPGEYLEGHVKDSINIPYDQISTLDINKDTYIFVYCASGKRSSIAYNTLINMGYKVIDLGAYQSITLDKE